MKKHKWCEHDEKISKYTNLNYECSNKSITLRIQSWFCPECGVHGAQSEIIDAACSVRSVAYLIEGHLV